LCSLELNLIYLSFVTFKKKMLQPQQFQLSLIPHSCQIYTTKITFYKLRSYKSKMDRTSRNNNTGVSHYQGFMITLRHTTLGRTPRGEWSAQSRDLYLKTHNNQKGTNIHDPGEIQTHNPSKWVFADLRLRLCGRWDWQYLNIYKLQVSSTDLSIFFYKLKKKKNC
jgi:hypothetical protein